MRSESMLARMLLDLEVVGFFSDFELSGYRPHILATTYDQQAHASYLGMTTAVEAT